eukprot:6198090-Pleurochrysis_carterae.AAC.2
MAGGQGRAERAVMIGAWQKLREKDKSSEAVGTKRRCDSWGRGRGQRSQNAATACKMDTLSLARCLHATAARIPCSHMRGVTHSQHTAASARSTQPPTLDSHPRGRSAERPLALCAVAQHATASATSATLGHGSARVRVSPARRTRVVACRRGRSTPAAANARLGPRSRERASAIHHA